jgi:hypothetical protein
MFDYEASSDQKIVLLSVRPRADEVFYETYDTTSAAFFRTAHQEASVPIDFGYPAFTKLGEVTGVASGGSTTFDWTGRGAAHYEWFARVRNGNVYRDSVRRGFDCTGVDPSGLTLTSHSDGATFFPSIAYTLEGTCDLGAAVEVLWDGVKVGDATVTGTDWEFAWTPDWDEVIVANGLTGAVLSVDDGSTTAEIDALVFSPALSTLDVWLSPNNPAGYSETAGTLNSFTNIMTGTVLSTKVGTVTWSSTAYNGRPGFTVAASSCIYGTDAVPAARMSGVPQSVSAYLNVDLDTPDANNACLCFARAANNSNHVAYFGTNPNVSGQYTYARRGAGAAAEQADTTAYALGVAEFHSAGGTDPVYSRVNGGAETDEALAGSETTLTMDRLGIGARVDATPDLFGAGDYGEQLCGPEQSAELKTLLRQYCAALGGHTLP